MDFNKSKSSSDNVNRFLGNFGRPGRDSVEVLLDSFFWTIVVAVTFKRRK